MEPAPCAPSVGHLLHLEQTRCPDSNPSLVWVVRIRSVLDFRVRCCLGCEQYNHNLTPSYKFNMRTRYNSKSFWVFSVSKAKTFFQRQHNWFLPRLVFNILVSVFSWGLTVKQNVCYFMSDNGSFPPPDVGSQDRILISGKIYPKSFSLTGCKLYLTIDRLWKCGRKIIVIGKLKTLLSYSLKWVKLH